MKLTKAERAAREAQRHLDALQPKPAKVTQEWVTKVTTSSEPELSVMGGGCTPHLVNPIAIPPLAPVPVEEWAGCYDDGWKDLITPESFAHPAKAARGLLKAIYTHLFEIDALGAELTLHKRPIVVDPFGGVGTTGIEGAWRGCQVVCCELEEKFATLARANVALHEARLLFTGRPVPIIINGDSRQLRRHLAEHFAESNRADVVISSPPFLGSNKDHAGLATSEHARDIITRGGLPKMGHLNSSDYGTSDGQLSVMAAGDVDAVISSPPYAAIASGAGGLNTKPGADGQQSGRSASSASQDTDQKYGDTPGQLAKLSEGVVHAVISSPPYAETILNDDQRTAASGGPLRWGTNDEYGTTPGQLGVLKDGSGVDAVISSPPYEGIAQSGGTAGLKQHGTGLTSGEAHFAEYGNTPGQLGRVEGDTFWTAARDIVRETFAILKPGGYAVWIVKSFVRNKQIVDFPGDWRRLCEYCGYITETEVHAMLVKEIGSGTDLFGDSAVERTERKSFFRRLQESKGSPRIDYEVVYIMRKPL